MSEATKLISIGLIVGFLLGFCIAKMQEFVKKLDQQPPNGPQNPIR